MNHQRHSCFSYHEVLNWNDSMRTSYSRFKYGSVRDANIFTTHLVNRILGNTSGISSSEIILTSSAFRHIPTAANLLVNQILSTGRYPDAERIKIHRMTVSEADYAKMDYAERFLHTLNVKLSFDQTINLRGKHLIIIDDLYFTGAHEKNLIELLTPHTDLIHFYYLVDLSGCDDPQMESKLNRYSISSIWDVMEILNSGHFELNARVAKYILSYPDPVVLQDFFEMIDYSWLLEFRKSVVLEEYSELPGFATNMQVLDQCLERIPWLSA